MFISKEDGIIEIWDTDKAILLKKFSVCKSKKPLSKIVRNMILSPDESFLSVATKNKIIYYSLKQLKDMPSKSVYSTLYTANQTNIKTIEGQIRDICEQQEPLNSFESNEFDIIYMMVDVANTIYTVMRN